MRVAVVWVVCMCVCGCVCARAHKYVLHRFTHIHMISEVSRFQNHYHKRKTHIRNKSDYEHEQWVNAAILVGEECISSLGCAVWCSV